MRTGLFLLLFLLLFVAPVTLLVLALQPEPAVRQSAVGVTADAVRTKAMLKRALLALLSPGGQTAIALSREDLSGALGFAARSLPATRSRVEMTDGALDAAATMSLPATPLGQHHLNLRYRMSVGEDGRAQATLRLGDIAIPGVVVARLGAVAADVALGERLGSRLLDSVRAVKIGRESMAVTIEPIEGLKASLKQAALRMRDMRDELALLGDPAVVGLYLQRLAELDGDRRGHRSLLAYARPLFALARERSDGGDAVAENRAAILAMAMYFGDARLFEVMIGHVRTGERSDIRSRPGAATLAGRNDLMLHFVISAGLKVVAMSGVSYAIGEFKELLDAAKGGSGFSFADLAADRAGVQLAERALDDQEGARRVQSVLAAADGEVAFFPDIAGLPEGLSEREFEATYGNVEAEPYKAMVEEIDRRIARCPAFG